MTTAKPSPYDPPPRTKKAKKTWKERADDKLKDTLDYEQNLVRRKELMEQMKTSYWTDFVNLNKKGVKQFEAASTLRKADRSIYLPDLEGKTLTGKEVSLEDRLLGKTTLVSFCFVAFGEPHVQSYIDPFRKAFKGVDEKIQCLQFAIEENYLKRPLVYLSTPYTRKRIPTEYHDNYIIFYQRMDALRRRLGITNTYLGWVFLVDAQMRVRWMAHGPALPKELADMERLTRTLHQRNVEAIAEEKAEEKADAAVKVTSP